MIIYPPGEGPTPKPSQAATPTPAVSSSPPATEAKKFPQIAPASVRTETPALPVHGEPQPKPPSGRRSLPLDNRPASLQLSVDLPAVAPFRLEYLPVALRGHVSDIAERMQVPADFRRATAIVSLAGCVGHRVLIQPKVKDTGWLVTPNLWSAIIGPPGIMKAPAVAPYFRILESIGAPWLEGYQEEYKTYEQDAKE